MLRRTTESTLAMLDPKLQEMSRNHPKPGDKKPASSAVRARRFLDRKAAHPTSCPSPPTTSRVGSAALLPLLSRLCGTRKLVGCPNQPCAHNRRPRLWTATGELSWKNSVSESLSSSPRGSGIRDRRRQVWAMPTRMCSTVTCANLEWTASSSISIPMRLWVFHLHAGFHGGLVSTTNAFFQPNSLNISLS